MPILEIRSSDGRHRTTAEVTDNTWHRQSGRRIGLFGQGYWERGREWTFWDRHENGGVAIFAFVLYQMNPGALLGTLRSGMTGEGLVAWEFSYRTPSARQGMLWRVL